MAGLQVVVVGREGGDRSAPALGDGSWERLTGGVGTTGWERRGLVEVPKGLGRPGAVLVTKRDDDVHDEIHRLDYVRGIRLTT